MANKLQFTVGSQEKILSNWLKRAFILLCAASGISILFGMIVLLVFLFTDPSSVAYLTEPSGVWGKLVPLIGQMLQIVVSILTIVAAIWIASDLNGKIDARRRKDEEAREEGRKQEVAAREESRKTEARARELIRISERMFDTEFYTKITAPTWEIAYKWRYWDGEDGDRYRADVLLGGLPASFSTFERPEQTRSARANLIRFHPHFMPYDHGSRKQPAMPINELSEHMVLMTWIRFWVHLDLLIEDWGILKQDEVQKAFAGWYEAWAEFSDEYLYDLKAISEELSSDMQRFERVHRILSLAQPDTNVQRYDQRLAQSKKYLPTVPS